MMRRATFLTPIIALLLMNALLLPVTADAATVTGPQGFLQGLQEAKKTAASANLSTATGKAAIENVINFVLAIVGVVALLALVLGGAMYIVSLGDEGRAERAKKIILYAIIGLVIVGLSLAIVNFVIGLI